LGLAAGALPFVPAAAGKKLWYILNHRTGALVGKASSVKRARNRVDKLDNEYGGYVHMVVPDDRLEETLARLRQRRDP